MVDGTIKYTRDYVTKGVVFPISVTDAILDYDGKKLTETLKEKVDVVEGKGLSTNDFSDDYKNILNYINSIESIATSEDIQNLFKEG